MKHMSSKLHHVGSPWSKQNAEYAANKFKEWGCESAVETFGIGAFQKLENSQWLNLKR